MQISDYSRYVSLMRNGFYDKLFFIDKLPGDWKSLLDWGCADGFLTKVLGEVFPDKRIVGYDMDPKMIQQAQMTGPALENVTFMNTARPESFDVLNLSSVIHEVHAYRSDIEINGFWKMVFQSGFKYIVIRDMLYDDDFHPWTFSVLDTMAIRDWCKENRFLGELKRFEEAFGEVVPENPKAVTHFLLKYLYMSSPNWPREVEENYLSMSIQSLTARIPKSLYKVIYRESSSLPYLQNRWEKDFGIDAMSSGIKTHTRLILQKK